MINEDSIVRNERTDIEDKRRRLYINPYYWISILVVLIISILGRNHSSVSSLIVIGLYSSLFSRPQYMIGVLIYTTIYDDYLLAFNSQSYTRYFVLVFIISTFLGALYNKERISSQGNRVLYVLSLAFLGIILSCYGLYGYTSFPMVYLINILMLMGFMFCPIHDAVKILQQIKKLFALSKYSSKGSLTIICTSFTDSIVSQFNEYVLDLDKLCNCHIGLNRNAFNQGSPEFYDKNETYAETIRQI